MQKASQRFVARRLRRLLLLLFLLALFLRIVRRGFFRLPLAGPWSAVVHHAHDVIGAPQDGGHRGWVVDRRRTHPFQRLHADTVRELFFESLGLGRGRGVTLVLRTCSRSQSVVRLNQESSHVVARIQGLSEKVCGCWGASAKERNGGGGVRRVAAAATAADHRGSHGSISAGEPRPRLLRDAATPRRLVATATTVAHC